MHHVAYFVDIICDLVHVLDVLGALNTETKGIRDRMIDCLLRPALQLAALHQVSLRELHEAVEVAYFQELRHGGMRMRDISELLGVSARKAASLSNRLKHRFAPETEIAVARRLEFLLWGQPLSRARILRALPGVNEQAVDQALSELVSDGRLREVRRSRSTVFERIAQHSRLVSANWASMLDAVANLQSNVAATVVARMVRDDRRAFARTISFYVRQSDLHLLRAEYERLWQRVEELEGDANGAPDAIAVDLSVLWAPVTSSKEKYA